MAYHYHHWRTAMEDYLQKTTVSELIVVVTETLIYLGLVMLLFVVLGVRNKRRNRKNAVGFFHPYTNDGGGGERVLWCAVKAIQEERPDLDCVVFTGDHDASPHYLMARATDRFGVQLISPPKGQTMCFGGRWSRSSRYFYVCTN